MALFMAIENSLSLLESCISPNPVDPSVTTMSSSSAPPRNSHPQPEVNGQRVAAAEDGDGRVRRSILDAADEDAATVAVQEHHGWHQGWRAAEFLSCSRDHSFTLCIVMDRNHSFAHARYYFSTKKTSLFMCIEKTVAKRFYYFSTINSFFLSHNKLASTSVGVEKSASQTKQHC